MSGEVAGFVGLNILLGWCSRRAGMSGKVAGFMGLNITHYPSEMH